MTLARQLEEAIWTPKVGDRVKVRKKMSHGEAVGGEGRVVEVSGEPALAILFDGEEEEGAHKWYVASELERLA